MGCLINQIVHNQSTQQSPAQVCAAREVFEETGLLLVPHSFTAGQLRSWRAVVSKDEGQWAQLLDACGGAAAVGAIDKALRPW
jgi:8-oxo-dGTP pyrophosphatase MutT (NUDIX family)